MNNYLKLNVDEQPEDIKQLKEQCDIDDENEVQEITAARNHMKNIKAVYVTCNQTFTLNNGLKNISRNSTLSSGEIFVATCSEIERKETITCVKHVNQPVMNGPQKMRLKLTRKTLLLRRKNEKNDEGDGKQGNIGREKNTKMSRLQYESEL